MLFKKARSQQWTTAVLIAHIFMYFPSTDQGVEPACEFFLQQKIFNTVSTKIHHIKTMFMYNFL